MLTLRSLKYLLFAPLLPPTNNLVIRVYLYVLQGVKTNKEIYLLVIQEYLFHINTISYLIQVFFQGEILFLFELQKQSISSSMNNS